MNLIMSWAGNHQQFLEGLVAGWAATHIPQVVGMVFAQAMRVPFIRAAIISNPEQAKKIIDQVAKELDADIDAEAAADKAAKAAENPTTEKPK